jgi:hypothetical protein
VDAFYFCISDINSGHVHVNLFPLEKYTVISQSASFKLKIVTTLCTKSQELSLMIQIHFHLE